MASYVIIWENNTFGHQKISGHTWPGHASMNISDRFASDNKEGRDNNYVSWWPGDGADFSIGGVIKSLFTKSQKGQRETYFANDVRDEGYLPDHIIRIDSSPQKQAAMRAEWATVHNKEGGASYKNLRKNCSTIVSRVLHAGGYYAQKWAVDSNFVWTPADVRKLADAAGGTHMTWTDFLKILRKSAIRPNDLVNDSGQQVTKARSGKLCSTGAPCKYQPDETWGGK